MLQRYRRVLSDYSFQIRIGTGCHVAIAARRVRTAIFANQYTVHVALECFGRVGGACLWRRIQEQGGKVVQQDFECQAEMMHPGACLDSYCQEKKQSKNVSSSSSQDEPEPQPGVQPMKSAGSVGHPDTCKECTFYFFSAAGCRNGADCTFCHEFHPRTNNKKNRRIMRTLQTREHHDTSQDGKEVTEDKPEREGQSTPSSECQSAPTVEKIEKVKVQEKSVQEDSSEGEVPAVMSSGGDGMLRVSYEKATSAGTSDSSGPVALTLIAGVRTHLRPQLHYASAEGQRCLEPTLAFVVQPPLPAGLSMDAKTGSISGIPESSQKARDVLLGSFPAQGYGGIALGDVPLASCKLFLTEACLVFPPKVAELPRHPRSFQGPTAAKLHTHRDGFDRGFAQRVRSLGVVTR
eukprot:s615_g33.t1